MSGDTACSLWSHSRFEVQSADRIGTIGRYMNCGHGIRGFAQGGLTDGRVVKHARSIAVFAVAGRHLRRAPAAHFTYKWYMREHRSSPLLPTGLSAIFSIPMASTAWPSAAVQSFASPQRWEAFPSERLVLSIIRNWMNEMWDEESRTKQSSAETNFCSII